MLDQNQAHLVIELAADVKHFSSYSTKGLLYRRNFCAIRMPQAALRPYFVLTNYNNSIYVHSSI